MNVVAMWLKLVGTPERAKKLRARLDSLQSPPEDPNFGPEPPQCPTTVLFGAEASRRLYSDPDYRPALDAWDNGSVGKSDLRRYCLWIEQGRYDGPIFYPSAEWQSSLRKMQTLNGQKAASLQQILFQRSLESRESNGREQRPASRDTVDQRRRAWI